MTTESRLLNLPAELRNRIYEFALSSPTPLILHSPQALRHPTPYKKYDPDLNAFNDGSILVEFNELKYVSKQLYSETAGLEFMYNDIKIEWGVLQTVNSGWHFGIRKTDWRRILFKKGDLVDVINGTASQRCRLETVWQYAKDVWEVRCGTHS